MPDLVEVKIDSLRVSLTNQQRIVVLKQVDTDRYLPIWIGPYEAEAITIALQEIEVSRPQTHDLLNNLITILDAHLIKVIISALKDDIFFGTLILEKEGKEIKVDSRPSDAIAIAVRSHVPIMVNAKVMEEASIIPEEVSESPEENPEASEDTGDTTSIDSTRVNMNDDRLSIFEDYFNGKPDENLPKKKNDDQDEDDSLEEKPS